MKAERVTVSIRLTDAEVERVRVAARRYRWSVTAYVRNTVLDRAADEARGERVHVTDDGGKSWHEVSK